VTTLRALERYARPRRPLPGERCELCAAPLAGEHRHVVDLDQRLVLCSCPACAILFVSSAAANGRYRTVPHRILFDAEFALTEGQWAALEIPVRLAFLFNSSRAARWLAFYPSPAGATESTLALQAWRDIAAEAPLLQSAEPDVEALLAYAKRGAAHFECFLVPIDLCYDLVGRVRRHWRGIDGGDAVWREIEDSFARIRRRARPLPASRPTKVHPLP
jgi:hypothetical protein